MTVSASTLIAVTTRILKIGIMATYITYVFVARAILGQTVKWTSVSIATLTQNV